MGYELRRWLADRLPADLSSGERLVALEIADQANDITRLAYSKDLLAAVARRAGFANVKQVRKVLTKLAAHHIELRVPKTRDGRPVLDRLGRPVYAHEGHETTYRIPTESECPALVTSRGLSELPCGGPLGIEGPPPGRSLAGSGSPSGCPSKDSGPPQGDEWTSPGIRKGPPSGRSAPPDGGPFSSISPQDPLISPSGAERHISAAGATPEETREIISIIRAEHRPRSLSAYIATLAANGDLGEILARVRSGVEVSKPSSTPVPPSFHELGALQPCPHGMPGGGQLRTAAGTPTCPACRTADASVLVRPVPDPAGVPARRPDLSGVRSQLADVRARTSPHRHTARKLRPVPDQLPQSALDAHAYLLERGDAHVWTSAARVRLGRDAPRADVLTLAAELARQDQGQCA